MKKIFVFLFLLLIEINPSYSIVFLEPYVGYATGAYHSKSIISGDPVNLDSKLDGISYGGRGGLSLSGLQIGFDYTKNEQKVKEYEDLATKNITTQEKTFFLGYRFYFLRFYAGYIFDVDLKEGDFKSGKGVKGGFSFYLFNNLALSLEGRTVDMDAYKISDGDDIDGNYSNLALLLSVPVEF